MEAIERVMLARAPERPGGRSYIGAIIGDFMELHGDKLYGDDLAICCGIGWLKDLPVTVLALDKGQDTKARLQQNFGSAHPEGYRKTLRHMRLAEKFGRPVISFIDTAGAFCGLEAEERGQGLAISENLMQLMALKVPVIAVLTGEGGSGGALALAVADRVWMLENAVYSVISPEGCASILWKDAGRVTEAAAQLKLTAPDLKALHIIERIFSEAGGQECLYQELEDSLYEELHALLALSPEELVEQRYQRFRRIPGGMA